jgi:large repetitive protein
MKALQLIVQIIFLFLFTSSTLAVQITYTSFNPCGGNTGVIQASASNGTPPYTYQWSNGENTANINFLNAGTYTLTVHDAVNATATVTVTLVDVPVFFADALTYVVPSGVGSGASLAFPCNSQCNGINFLSVQYVEGMPPYTITTTPYHPFGYYGPNQIPGIQNVCATDNYTAVITDSRGCTGTAHNQDVFPQPTSFSNIAQIFGVCNGSVGHARFEFINCQGIMFSAVWTGPESGGIYYNAFPVFTLDSLTPGNYVMTVTNTATYTSCDTVINFTIPGSVTGTVPAQPGSIAASGGIIKACPGENKTYFISPVPGATSYTWTPPYGGFILSGQGTVSVVINFGYTFPASDTLRVVAHNTCGTSPERKLKISRNIPAVPGTITASGGNTKVCPGTSKTYSIAAVAGATSYIWTKPAGSVITSGQGTTSVTLLFNSGFVATDTLQVKSSNACGQSANRNLFIYRNNPATPSAISGLSMGTCNLTAVPYSVTNISGMTYNWSFGGAPATIASGQGTSQVTVNFNPTFITGTLSVTATNGCGTSAVRNKTIYAKPATPASITGATSVCLNQQNVPYSISPISNVTNYTWTGPTGSHISDGNSTSAGITLITTSTAVTVDFGTVAGNVKVRANNNCASGSYKSAAVAIVCRESYETTDSEEFNFSIAPNPNSGSFTIELNREFTSPVNLAITNSLGEKIKSFSIQHQKTVELDLNLQPGVYFIEMRGNSNTVARKMLVQ